MPGDDVKKPMRSVPAGQITQEWLYHIGVPVDQIPRLSDESAVCVPTMMPYITAFFMPRTKGDRPDVIPDGCVNFAFLGQFADTPRDTVFTTEYSVRTAMEAVYGLLGVDRGVPEVWGSVYDVRALLDSSVCLMDGRSPLEIELPGPLNLLKKPILKAVQGTVVEAAAGPQHPAGRYAVISFPGSYAPPEAMASGGLSACRKTSTRFSLSKKSSKSWGFTFVRGK